MRSEIKLVEKHLALSHTGRVPRIRLWKNRFGRESVGNEKHRVRKRGICCSVDLHQSDYLVVSQLRV